MTLPNGKNPLCYEFRCPFAILFFAISSWPLLPNLVGSVTSTSFNCNFLSCSPLVKKKHSNARIPIFLSSDPICWRQLRLRGSNCSIDIKHNRHFLPFPLFDQWYFTLFRRHHRHGFLNSADISLPESYLNTNLKWPRRLLRFKISPT